MDLNIEYKEYKTINYESKIVQLDFQIPRYQVAFNYSLKCATLFQN